MRSDVFAAADSLNGEYRIVVAEDEAFRSDQVKMRVGQNICDTDGIDRAVDGQERCVVVRMRFGFVGKTAEVLRLARPEDR